MTERRTGDAGQSSVELALVLPVVVLVMLLIVQVVAIARHQLLRGTRRTRSGAGRGGVRRDPRPPTLRSALHRRASGLDATRLDVRTTIVGEQVQVSITYRDPTEVPLAGSMVPELGLTAEAIMQRER